MTPIIREYLTYLIAVLCGFAVFYIVANVLMVDYGIAIFAGFAGIHLALVIQRRFFP